MRYLLDKTVKAYKRIPGPIVTGCVVLLHGLGRSSASMLQMERELLNAGYGTVRVDYPSRQADVGELATRALGAAITAVAEIDADVPVHFVTHSMGGILLRAYLKDRRIERFGRAVMLAPPNQGSEVVDRLRNIPGFEMINGPAGLQLGTDPASIPSSLGRVEESVGIIAGSRSINPILSMMMPRPNDGKVEVERAAVEGMGDFLTMEVSHTFIMQRSEVIVQVLHFLEHGAFRRSASPPGP
jgi:pimeloyl-ACP methyl ester carboxylesterase